MGDDQVLTHSSSQSPQKQEEVFHQQCMDSCLGLINFQLLQLRMSRCAFLDWLHELCLRQPKGQLASSSCHHNTLTTLITSVIPSSGFLLQL